MILTSVAFVVGCQINPISGRSQLILIPEASAIASSREAYLSVLKPIQEKGKLDNNRSLTKRVVTITELLIAQAIKYRPDTERWRWSVHVIDEPKTINAWAMAGGRMAIYSGLITQLNATDDEIAQVMGHEIAHALLAHIAEKMSRGLALQAGLSAIAISQSDEKYSKYKVQGAALAAIVALELPHSRSAEREADELGMILAAKAGFDPAAAVTLWKKMGETSKNRPLLDGLFSTHPLPEDRQLAMEKLIPKAQPFFDNKSTRPVYKLKDDGLGKDETIF